MEHKDKNITLHFEHKMQLNADNKGKRCTAERSLKSIEKPM